MDTFDDLAEGAAPINRGYCQIKVFCDKVNEFISFLLDSSQSLSFPLFLFDGVYSFISPNHGGVIVSCSLFPWTWWLSSRPLPSSSSSSLLFKFFLIVIMHHLIRWEGLKMHVFVLSWERDRELWLVSEWASNFNEGGGLGDKRTTWTHHQLTFACLLIITFIVVYFFAFTLSGRQTVCVLVMWDCLNWSLMNERRKMDAPFTFLQ